MVNAWVDNLFRLLNDSYNQVYIRWNEAGNGFIVLSERGFSLNILPHYFSTSKWSAFMRNLGYYNFHRVSGDADSCEYIHPVFHRDHEDRLHMVSGGWG